MSRMFKFFSRVGCWKTKPICVRRRSASWFSVQADRSLPQKDTLPLSMRSIPLSAKSSVDFPEPEGPITEINSPSRTDRLMPSRMRWFSDPS